MIFKYKGKTRYGEEQKGAIEAASKEGAIETLQRQGVIVIDVAAQRGESILKKDFSFFQGVSNYEVVTFSRQLSVLFDAKVPLVEALHTLAEQTENMKFRGIIGEIERNVDAGMPLSKALAGHKKVFSNFYIALVKSGEVSGKLQEVLTYLADFQERSYYLMSKARSAMIYPGFILGAFVIIITIMLTYVVPTLTAVFEGVEGLEIPFITRVIIALSKGFQTYALFLVLFLILSIGGIYFYARTRQGKEMFDTLKLKLPVIKGIFQKLYLARFADTLGTMIHGGLPITQALEITSEVIGNSVYEKLIMESKTEVQKGSMISATLKKNKQVIPPLVYQMIYIGESTGRLDSILKSLASFYSKEVNAIFDNLVTMIEPILIVGIGIFVGVFVISIIMPIYNIAQTF